MPPSDGPPNARIHRWLRSRIDAVLDRERVPIRAQGLHPGPIQPPASPPPLQDQGLGLEEEDEDLETELAAPWEARVDPQRGSARPPTPKREPDTVQLNHIPVAFIGESVMDDVTIQDLRVDSVRWRAEGYAKGIAVTPLAPQPRGTQQQQGAAPEELSGRRTPGPELIPGPPPPPPPPPGLRTVPLSRMVPPPSPQGTVPPELRASVCWTSQDAPSFSTIQPRAAEVRPVQEPGRLPEARILGVALGVSVVVGMGLLGLGLWLLL